MPDLPDRSSNSCARWPFRSSTDPEACPFAGTSVVDFSVNAKLVVI